MRDILVAGTLTCALALSAGCSSDEPDDRPETATETTASSPSQAPTAEETETADETQTPESATPEPEPEGTVIEVTLADGEVKPAGERVEAKVREPIIFMIDADAAGELHVHSVQGQEIAFQAGRSTHEIVIDRPGVVEVELHEPALIVVQLEVR